jgi:amino acid transporter
MDPENGAAKTPPSSIRVEIALDLVYGQTKRGLSGRHVQLMALGGSIGTALFVGIGGALRTSGPISLILGYMVYCLTFIYPCNLAVGEMAAHLPIRGSIFEFAKRYVNESFGFTLGWTYFYTATMLLCAELSAIATVEGFWDEKTNPATWVALSLTVMITINAFAVRWYGESEFIMAVSSPVPVVVRLRSTEVEVQYRKRWRYFSYGNLTSIIVN